MIRRRLVTISVCMPVTVTSRLTTDDENDEDLDDWQITGVCDVRTEASARSVSENMDDETAEELVRLAKKAKDIR